jgi:hypothetical protein
MRRAHASRGVPTGTRWARRVFVRYGRLSTLVSVTGIYEIGTRTMADPHEDHGYTQPYPTISLDVTVRKRHAVQPGT